METASGTPAAIRTWWYPGERRGYEFIFPKEQARRLGMGASQPVLTTDAQTTTTEQTNTADLSRVGSSGQETDVSASAAPTPAAPSGTTQEGTIASSSLNCDAVDSDDRQCDHFSAEVRDRSGLDVVEVHANRFGASRAHSVAANGKSASAGCDRWHRQSLECRFVAVLAYTVGRVTGERAPDGRCAQPRRPLPGS
ncbi:MAG TPA: hypothetical protein VFU28_14270 [Vicinamibacterales bacterium]|nr:hypothetical protein [Vicinamibacterales bacterium]